MLNCYSAINCPKPTPQPHFGTFPEESINAPWGGHGSNLQPSVNFYPAARACNEMLERVIERRVRKIVKIDNMQFGFIAGRSTRDAISIVPQLQEKYLAKKRDLKRLPDSNVSSLIRAGCSNIPRDGHWTTA